MHTTARHQLQNNCFSTNAYSVRKSATSKANCIFGFPRTSFFWYELVHDTAVQELNALPNEI